MDDPKLEDFLNIVNRLEPKARRDVLDVSVFLVWRDTRELNTPTPWRSVIRGGWLFGLFRIEKFLKGKLLKKIILIFSMAFFAMGCTLANDQSAQLTHSTDQPAQVSQTPTPVCTVIAIEALNLRDAPGTSAAVIDTLRHGDVLTILPQPAQGNWIHVNAGDHKGWIHQSYCKKIGE